MIGKKFPIDSLPIDIPKAPWIVYKNKGWSGFGDWLGTGRVATFNKKYRDFEAARDFVHKLKLKSSSEWRLYVKGEYKDKPPLPSDISASPQRTYKDKGWRDYGDWLGTGTVASQKLIYKNFKEARNFVRKLKLKNVTEWKKFPKDLLPKDIPKTPERIYKNKGWKGIKDWLGTK